MIRKNWGSPNHKMTKSRALTLENKTQLELLVELGQYDSYHSTKEVLI